MTNQFTTRLPPPRLVAILELERVRTASSRVEYWDIVRGFAILLVILGHAIQYFVPNYENTIGFRFIYSFHMPLFMFLSGYLASGVSFYKNGSLAKKAVALLVPFISWGIVFFIFDTRDRLKTGLPPRWIFFWNLIVAPDWGLWFLWVLFFCFGVLYFIQLIPRHRFLLAVIIYFWLRVVNDRILLGFAGSGLLVWQIPFFLIGYFSASQFDFARRSYHWLGWFGFILFVALFPYWNKSGNPTFYAKMGWIERPWLTEMFMLLVPLSAISAILYLFSFCRRSLRFLSLIGIFTLEIYATHTYFLGLNRWFLPQLPLIFDIGLNVFIALVCCVLFIALAKQSTFLNLVLFGKRAVK